MILMEQLTRLAEIAPEVCQRDQIGDFVIDGITFYTDNQGVFGADITSRGRVFLKENDALDLLRGRIERVIEARGWYWEVSYPPHETTGEHWANIRIGESRYFYGEAVDAAEALLAALLSALGEGAG